MGATSAASEAFSTIKRNPVLILVTLLYGIFQIPQLVTQFADSTALVIAGGVFSLVFLLLIPFYFGGVIGMASEGLNGKTSFRTFLQKGKAHYVSIFGAYLLWFVFLVVLMIAIGVIGVVGGLFASSAGSGGMGGTSLIIGVIVALLLVALVFGFVLFTQFFGQAIVLDDRSAVGGFRGSISAVRGNKLSTLGYMVVVFLISIVFVVLGTLIGVLPALVGSQNTLVVTAVLVVVSVLMTGVLGAFTTTYGVAFYNQIRSSAEQAPENSQH